MCHANISKYNSKLEKQVILLMIEDKAKLHYLVVIKLSSSLRKQLIMATFIVEIA